MAGNGWARVYMGRVVFRWATFVLRWAAFSCRVRAGTACRDRGPDTTRPSCRADTDTIDIVSCRVRVVFF
jgi:hypothetical protein